MSANSLLTISQCLEHGQLRLASADSQSQHDAAKLESEILLAQVLEKPRSYLYTWPDELLSIDKITQFNSLIEDRYAGMPVAYLTGSREFWGLPLSVTPDTLIPRPETERLVEIALQYIPQNSTARIADLGTGSGAIALALATERPQAIIEATDIDAATLAVARRNVSALGLSNVNLHHGHWCEVLTEKSFDMIVSNPPYVTADDPHLHQGDLRFEPAQALTSGKDGLKDIREIIQTATQHLANGAYLLIEHGYDQADRVTELFQKAGYSEVSCFQDYAERERATIGRWLTL